MVFCPIAAAATEAEAPAQQTGKPTLHNQPAPDTYAVVEVGGKQMFVEPGKWYTCNRLQVSSSTCCTDAGCSCKSGSNIAV